LLLGPVFLAAEFFGNVFPGLLFYILLIIKKNPLAYSVFEASFLGYRTKLILVIFIALMIGRLLGTPYAMLQAGVFPGNSPIQLEKSKRSKEQDFILHLTLGAIVMPSLIGKSKIMDYLVIANAGVYLSFSSGFALLIGSAIPGDGQTLRIIELVVGALFMISGYFQAKHFMTAMAAFVGMSLKEFIEKIPAAHLPALLPIVTIVFQYLNKPADQAKPAGAPEGQPKINPVKDTPPSA